MLGTPTYPQVHKRWVLAPLVLGERSRGAGRASVHQHFRGESIPAARLRCPLCCLQCLLLPSTGKQFTLTFLEAEASPPPALLCLRGSAKGSTQAASEGKASSKMMPEEPQELGTGHSTHVWTHKGWRFGETRCYMLLQDGLRDGGACRVQEGTWWGKGE